MIFYELFVYFGMFLGLYASAMYLEAYNNQKQSEISNRKSLFISVF